MPWGLQSGVDYNNAAVSVSPMREGIKGAAEPLPPRGPQCGKASNGLQNLCPLAAVTSKNPMGHITCAISRSPKRGGIKWATSPPPTRGLQSGGESEDSLLKRGTHAHPEALAYSLSLDGTPSPHHHPLCLSSQHPPTPPPPCVLHPPNGTHNHTHGKANGMGWGMVRYRQDGK